MKKKLMVCFLAVVMVLGSASALAKPKIASASKEATNTDVQSVTVGANGQSIAVSYSGVKDRQYVVMAVSEDAIDTASNLPTKGTINNNQNHEIVYMDQAEGDSNGAVLFDVSPDLTNSTDGSKYGIFISGTGVPMVRIGDFTISLDDLVKLIGDVNGDGEVKPNDRTILARFLAGWDGYDETKVNMENADINGDGEVKPNDRTILARILAGWDGYSVEAYQR